MTALCTTACLCLSAFLLKSDLEAFPKTSLISPVIAEDAIIETSVSVNDFRERGIRVEPAYIREKLIIHNYGHGGASLPLSWGSATKAFEYLELEVISGQFIFDFGDVAVLGADVIGLTTANLLLDRGYKVTVYSDKFASHLTDDLQEGLWWPSAVSAGHSHQEKSVFKHILKCSYDYFKSIADQKNRDFAGVMHKTIYKFDLSDTHHNDPVEEFLHNGIFAAVRFSNGTHYHGVCYDTFHIDPVAYGQSLYEQVLVKGGVFRQQKFRSLEDLVELNENVIFNCIGKGSKQLFDDHELSTVRHQTVSLLPQEGVDYMAKSYHANGIDSTTIFVLDDRIVLGGVYQYNDENAQVDPEHTALLLNHARNFFH